MLVILQEKIKAENKPSVVKKHIIGKTVKDEEIEKIKKEDIEMELRRYETYVL